MSMKSLFLGLSLITCWSAYLHLKLLRESRRRRELALAFRQHLVERRLCATHPAI